MILDDKVDDNERERLIRFFVESSAELRSLSIILRKDTPRVCQWFRIFNGQFTTNRMVLSKILKSWNPDGQDVPMLHLLQCSFQIPHYPLHLFHLILQG